MFSHIFREGLVGSREPPSIQGYPKERKGKRQWEIQKAWGLQKNGLYNHQEPEVPLLDNAAMLELLSTRYGDMKVINLSDIRFENGHLDLLKKGFFLFSNI